MKWGRNSVQSVFPTQQNYNHRQFITIDLTLETAKQLKTTNTTNKKQNLQNEAAKLGQRI